MKKAIIFTLFFVFLISIVGAAPPVFQESSSLSGLDIKFPQTDMVMQNQDIKFHTHVYNISDGLLVTNETTTCNIHLYDSTGSHVLEREMEGDSNRVDFKLDIDGGNFSTIQRMSAIVYCNASTAGGFISFGFDVTPTGEQNIFGFQIFLFILFFGLVILGFLIRNEWITILGGLGLIIIGIFSLTQGISNFRNELTNLISFVTIGFGAMISIGTAIEVIRDGM